MATLGKKTSPSRFLHRLGTTLVVLGFLLLAIVGAYFGYSLYTRSKLQDLNKELSAEAQAALLAPEATSTQAPSATQADNWDLETQELSRVLPIPTMAAAQATLQATPVPTGHLATRIVIPSIGVDSPVVELGTKIKDGELVWETANRAVGHYKTTANPGAPGNVVMSGHISSPVSNEGEVFKNLPNIKLEDEITVYTDAGRHLYQVVKKEVVKPTRTDVMDPTPRPTLTLITCVPDLVYTHRLIVTALEVPAAP
ncbi:MAG: sortase [Chloroflexi bacterium]|nr:sortase [Chloroflexota bacterium]